MLNNTIRGLVAVMTNAKPVCILLAFLVTILVLVLRPLRIFLVTVNEEPVLLNWFPSPYFGAGETTTHGFSCEDFLVKSVF